MERKTEQSAVSLMLDEKRLVELLYDPSSKTTKFAVGDGEKIELTESVTGQNGQVYVPLRGSNSLLKHGVVLLPSEPLPYGSRANLIAEIEDYIRRYVSFSPEFVSIAAHYVLLTWVYDRFNEVPYLRFKGDFGSGKTRALTVLGSICYKPVFASGASTVSPIFHILDLFRGTLIFDEADFRFSDERTEITKIFNNGTVRGFPVLRTNVSDKKEFDPRAYDVFGPKIIAMREVFQDYALESRFLTEEMRGVPSAGIPLNLPDVQRSEALALRGKLLSFRLAEWHSIHIGEGLRDDGLSSRANQILIPLLSIAEGEAVRASMRRLAERQGKELALDRSTQVESLVLDAILTIRAEDEGRESIPLSEVKKVLLRLHSAEFDRPITSRFLGSVVRNRLGLSSYKSGVYLIRVPAAEELTRLSARFGVELVRAKAKRG